MCVMSRTPRRIEKLSMTYVKHRSTRVPKKIDINTLVRAARSKLHNSGFVIFTTHSYSIKLVCLSIFGTGINFLSRIESSLSSDESKK